MNEVDGLVEKIIAGLLAALGVLMGIIFKSVTGKIKALDEKKLDRDVFQQHSDAVLEELRESRKERREDLDKLSEKIDNVHRRIDDLGRH